MLSGYRKLTGYSTLGVALALTIPVLARIDTECFSSGIVGECPQFISTFCNSTAYTVRIKASDSVGRCFNAGDIKCDFTAWNKVPVGVDGNNPNEDNCNAALQDVVAQCNRGGQAMVIEPGTNFLYTMQPNTGLCASNIADDGASL